MGNNQILNLCYSGQIENIELAISLAKSQDLINLLTSFEHLFHWLKVTPNFDDFILAKFNVFEIRKPLSKKIQTIVSIDALHLGGGDTGEVSIPKEFYLFKNLEELHISAKKIIPPKSSQKLPKIVILSLYSLSPIPDFFLQLNTIKKLTLSILDYTVLSNFFEKNTLIEEVEIINTNSITLPLLMKQLTFIKKFSIGDSSITYDVNIPKKQIVVQNLETILKDLNQLESLTLYNIKLLNIDDTLKYLPNLKVLELCACGLDKVPTPIKNLHHIKTLDLTLNKIQEIPTWIHELSSLDDCDIK